MCGSASWDDIIRRVDVTAFHTGATLSLDLVGAVNDGVANESWGIDHVHVLVR